MATKEHEQAVALYASILAEAKHRLNSIDHALAGQTGLLSPFVREFCFLQLRMLCELIALGALVIHGDIPATKSGKFRSAYAAGAIVQMLDRIHPDFYQQPIELTSVGSTKHFGNFEGDFLTMGDLIRLNGQCGDILHRGNMKKLLPKTPPIQLNHPEIRRYADKVRNLLNCHRMMLLGGRKVIVCFLSDPLGKGEVRVSYAEATDK